MTADVMVSGLLDIPQRPMELGRIRLGEKGDRGQPVRLKTFRLTSGSRERLEAAARLYGGKVRAWQGAPDEGMWEVTTAAAELDVLISRAIESVSQSYELWQGGTCSRRCDGTTERITESPCICAASGQTGPDRTCEIITRLRVILPRLPGIGTWRLETGGWVAATTIPVTVRMLAETTDGAWIPATLRAAQASRKVRGDDGKVMTHRWVQPELDHPIAIGQLLAASGSVDAPMLEATVTKPATAAERAVQRAAAVTTSAPASVPTRAPADAPSPAPDDTDTGEGGTVMDGNVKRARCDGFDDSLGRCRQFAGHEDEMCVGAGGERFRKVAA